MIFLGPPEPKIASICALKCTCNLRAIIFLPQCRGHQKLFFLITTIDIDNDLTASNTAPTSVIAATNSAATSPLILAPLLLHNPRLHTRWWHCLRGAPKDGAAWHCLYWCHQRWHQYKQRYLILPFCHGFVSFLNAFFSFDNFYSFQNMCCHSAFCPFIFLSGL